MFNLNALIRENIKNLKPYSSARDEYSGSASVFLDANENPFNTPYNRYPDPFQGEVKEKLAAIKGVPAQNIFLGNGSDEPIDLLYRAFCEPKVDNVISISPSYGMYTVCANINNVELRNVLLTKDFQLEADAVLEKVDAHTKLIFLCSPNNPSGNLLDKVEMLKIVTSFHGLVVVDEAYIDFCPDESLLGDLLKHPNLVILQTFSKAWGLAGVRFGMAYVSNEILTVLNKIKYPYNLNILTQKVVLEQMENLEQKEGWVNEILEEKEQMIRELRKLDYVSKIYPSDANFVLIKAEKAREKYNILVEKSIIIRDRSKVVLCEDCLRITIGSKEENKQLFAALKEL